MRLPFIKHNTTGPSGAANSDVELIRTKLVSALDIAHALARELDLETGLLPSDALWWAKTASGVRVSCRGAQA